MKIYISADIEGVACISAPGETDMNVQGEYAPFRRQMTAEVQAACDGAWQAGATSIVVKDAHWTGRNLDPHSLATPEGKSLQLIRGWSGHPFSMVQGIDRSFDKVMFVGYHSAAGTGGNPLSHTVSGALFARIELNGELASEFRLFALAASTVGVPVAFLSGDRAQCEEAARLVEGVVTVPIFEGLGPSVVSIAPDEAVRRIRAAAASAAKGDTPLLAIPKDFHFKLTFARAREAYSRSFYPGAKQVSDTELVLETSNYFDVLTFLKIASKMT